MDRGEDQRPSPPVADSSWPQPTTKALLGIGRVPGGRMSGKRAAISTRSSREEQARFFTITSQLWACRPCAQNDGLTTRDGEAARPPSIRRNLVNENHHSQNPSAAPNDSVDRFMLRLQAALAEYENELRQKRMMRGIPAKDRSGHALRREEAARVAKRTPTRWSWSRSITKPMSRRIAGSESRPSCDGRGIWRAGPRKKSTRTSTRAVAVAASCRSRPPSTSRG